MTELSRALVDALGLELAHVAPIGATGDRADAAARGLASYLDDAVRRPMTIGCGWGRTLRGIARHVTPARTSGVVFVDIIGSSQWWSSSDEPFDLSIALGGAYGATVLRIPAPAFALSADEAAKRHADPRVRAALELAARAELIIVSPGTANPETSSVVITGGLTGDEMRDVRASGAVGDIVGLFYSARGDIVSSPADARSVRLGADALRSTRVAAISVGTEKLAAIRGAAASGLIRALFTDELTARELLADAG